jgi:hypothetical protein
MLLSSACHYDNIVIDFDDRNDTDDVDNVDNVDNADNNNDRGSNVWF